jgi:CHAT domain-containing protein
VRARLGGDVLLTYFLGENDLYLWTVRGDGLRMMDLGARRPLLEEAGRVWKELSKGRTPAAASLDRLSRALLGPAGPLPAKGAKLRIAPDGLLHYLPFEILEHPAAPGAPLVDRATVSYLPSASALVRTAHRKAAPDLRLVGFGAPRRPGRSVELAASFAGLPPLPGAERELAAVGRLLGGGHALLTGERATERAFRERVARGAQVMHFATHTVVDERPGRGSAILLTPAEEDDGLLFPREIAGLDGRCELTVLAACSTALGSPDEEDGRALVSLTGSFLAAGSAAVVATLWDVGDAATAAFMEQLYDQLGRGVPPAAALRRAKLRLRADPRWDQPSLWAGYVLVGEAGPVAPRRDLRVAGIASLAALAVLLWLSGRRASRSPA